MYDQAFGSDGEAGEERLHAAIRELQGQRISEGEAWFRFYLGVPSLLLSTLGQARVFLVIVAALVAELVAAAIASLPLALLALVVMVATSLYIAMNLSGWVAAHNREIDDRIRALLAQAQREAGGDG